MKKIGLPNEQATTRHSGEYRSPVMLNTGEQGLRNTSVYFALRAALCAFKIVPDDFVERRLSPEPATHNQERPPLTLEAFLDYLAGEQGFEP